MGLNNPESSLGRRVRNTFSNPDGNIVVPISFELADGSDREESWLTYKPLFCHNGTWRGQMNADRILFIPRCIKAIVDETAMHPDLGDRPQMDWVNLELALTDIFSKDFSLNADYFGESLREFNAAFHQWEEEKGIPKLNISFFLPYLIALFTSIHKQYHKELHQQFLNHNNK